MESNTAAGTSFRDTGSSPNRSIASPGDALTQSYVGGQNSLRQGPKERTDLPEPGEKFGNYHLIRRLGKGAMGTVFEADDLASGRRVALKLLAHSLESPEAKNRFFREGRLAASINHPNSVYVYGTEEIEGIPAISMEAIAGGTLSDRVRQQGPFPVAQAVDVILQVVDGLDAAAKAGVLHRDVKPSNCFIDVEGTVKVGDFGLSISTTARGDSHLTQAGSFLGTPAFSSPEQLRGDELDVRSDIYAVGVTLYYLLTGRTPYEAQNLVKLLAMVLEQPTPSPLAYRKDIPQGLARVVLRCLAKQPSGRFKNYAELRKALTPYNTTAPTPATLALRGVAGFCDSLVLSSIVGLMQGAWFADLSGQTVSTLFRSWATLASTAAIIGLQILYFAVPEGLWGASLSKLLFRIRVVDRDRGQIGIPRAAVRAAVYVVFPGTIIWVNWIFGGTFPFDTEQIRLDARTSWIPYSSLGVLLLLFSSARRRNGYAGLHDLATGATVVLRSSYYARPPLDAEDQPQLDNPAQETIGPYHVLDTLNKADCQEFLLGYDTRLLRRVWIHTLPANAPSVSAARRQMGRVGRLRWINGRRGEPQCWDAYESLSGRPLLNLLGQPQTWGKVRYWLSDLAQELSAAEKDSTLPEVLALDRIWVTAEGRAKLLDFPAPGADTKTESIVSMDAVSESRAADSAQHFLFQVAKSALEGRVIDCEATNLGSAAARLPVDACSLLKRLPTVGSLDRVAGELERLLKRMPSVTRLRRVAMLSAISFFPLVAMLSTLESLDFSPEITKLRSCLMCMDVRSRGSNVDSNNPQKEQDAAANQKQFETYISGTFRDTTSDRSAWNGVYAQTIPLHLRVRAERIIADRPRPSEEELQKAAAVVEPLVVEFNAAWSGLTASLSPIGIRASAFVFLWFLFVTIPSVLASVAIRRGTILRSFGVDCVTRKGVPASRLRMLGRSIVFNLPFILAPMLVAFIFPFASDLAMALLPVVGLQLALVVWSSLLRERGLTDRLSGTFPVPR